MISKAISGDHHQWAEHSAQIHNKQAWISLRYLCGTLIGECEDFIIMDDPQTPLQANTRSGQDISETGMIRFLSSRLNDPTNGDIILIMQR